MSVTLTRSWHVAFAFALVLSLFFGSLPLVSHAAVQVGKTINLEVIVDSSGSMAAATDTGVLRIDAAKRVLTEVISQIPEAEGVNVGFRVYGHRGNNQPEGQAESCVSSDLLVPMQGVDKAALTAQVDALQPVGWTPLGYALEQAANDFTQPAGESVVNAIIMVTDGLETCGADTAAIAGKLKNSPAGITTHIIGFGTTPEELASLQSITQASGGQLLGSNNAGQLMSSLFAILEELEVVEESGVGTTREAPVAVGRIARIGDYDVSVLNAQFPQNAVQTGPDQDIYARVSVTYRGPLSGIPGNDLVFSAVGELNSSYTAANNSCSGFGNGIDSANELFEGGSAEFNVCWTVKAEDADSLLMFVEPRGVPQGEGRTWFSLASTQTSTNGQSSDGVTSPEDPVGPVNPTAIYVVTSIDIAYEAAELTIPANTDVTIQYENHGVLEHNFNIDQAMIYTDPIPGGASTSFTVNLPPGIYEFYCSVPGHKEAGEVGTLIVD